MRNSGEPQRKWAIPVCLPPHTVGHTAAVIAAVKRGTRFTLNGW